MIVDVNENHFRNYIINSSRKLILVYYYATWSRECEEFNPVIESISRKYALLLDVLKVNIDVEKNLVQWGNVRSVPTLFVFKTGNDQPVDKATGYVTEENLEFVIEKYLGRI